MSVQDWLLQSNQDLNKADFPDPARVELRSMHESFRDSTDIPLTLDMVIVGLLIFG